MNASRRLVCRRPSLLRVGLLRTARPQLRRNADSAFRQSTQPPPPPPPGAPLPTRKRFFTWPVMLISVTALALGSSLGEAMRTFWPAEPGSKQDAVLSQEFDIILDKLPLVHQLRKQVEEGQWEEHTAYQNIEGPARKSLFTAGALAGSRGVGKQLIFRNKETKELVCVLRIGAGVSGWPLIAHGGVLATLLDECLGRVSIMCFGGRPAVTANLELNYREKTPANSFIVIRAKPTSVPSESKAFVEGTVERLDGMVTVQAKGLFVVPKSVQLMQIDDKF